MFRQFSKVFFQCKVILAQFWTVHVHFLCSSGQFFSCRRFWYSSIAVLDSYSAVLYILVQF